MGFKSGEWSGYSSFLVRSGVSPNNNLCVSFISVRGVTILIRDKIVSRVKTYAFGYVLPVKQTDVALLALVSIR